MGKVVVIVFGKVDHRLPKLLHKVHAACVPGLFLGLTQGGQEQTSQNRYDSDHHQQFDQGETMLFSLHFHWKFQEFEAETYASLMKPSTNKLVI